MEAWETKIMEVLGRKDCILSDMLGVGSNGEGKGTYGKLGTHDDGLDGGN